MEEVSNETRAGWAAAAAEEFCRQTSQEIERDGRWEVVGDLICDLLHWLDQEHATSEPVIERALMHYRAEVADEAEEGPRG
jgi:hypothetical protein